MEAFFSAVMMYRGRYGFAHATRFGLIYITTQYSIYAERGKNKHNRGYSTRTVYTVHGLWIYAGNCTNGNFTRQPRRDQN